MIFKIILIVNIVLYVSAEVFQVKCGDEKCERPANSAVTTLRYSPDKPYKLQIYAVNSDVDIYGMTNDLYFCRYGKNFGFLPKKHLREKSRGNFPFDVTVDLTSKVIDQSMREQNFLHLFVNTPQSNQEPIGFMQANNETVNSTTSEENIDLRKKLEEETKFLDHSQHSHAETTTTTTTDATTNTNVPSANNDLPNKPDDSNQVKKEDENTDSGIEDEGDNEDEDDDDDVDEDENEETNVKKETVVDPEPQQEQPELIAIPPARPKAEELPTNPDSGESREKEVEEVTVQNSQPSDETTTTTSTPTLPQEATSTDKPVEFDNSSPPETIGTPSPVIEEDLVPTDFMNNYEVNNTIPQENTAEPAPVNEIVIETTEEPATKEIFPNETLIKDDLSTTVTLADSEFKKEEVEIENSKTNEPAETTESVKVSEEAPESAEKTIVQTDNITTVPVIENIDLSISPEKDNVIETGTTSTDNVDTTTTVPTEIVESTTQIPEEIETTTDLPEIVEVPQPEFVETTTSQPKFKPSEPDALMNRLRQKLDNKVKDIQKPEDQHHHHDNHDHSHHSHDHHDHSHGHSHSLPHKDEESPPIVSIDDKQESDGEPGFFGGIYQKFFGNDQSLEETDSKKLPAASEVDEGFCEKIDGENCPKKLRKPEVHGNLISEVASTDELLKMFLQEIINNMDLVISISLTAMTVLLFTFGYYCISKSRKEGPLIGKINELERHLMASVKENEIIKADNLSTKHKLMSIQDNSFGSNDMVIALKKDLEAHENERQELLEKIDSLESQLETATEDALELNKMVSELLNNQTGSETILSTVEELQSQLNEQQETITTVNDSLAAKSRENSELLMQLAHIEENHVEEIRVCRQGADAIALERNNLLIEIGELKRETDVQLSQLVQERNSEITRLNTELTNYIKKFEDVNKKYVLAESKAQAMEEVINAMKRDGKSADFKQIFDVADLKADLLATSKEKSTVQEMLQNEKDSKKLLEDRAKGISEEMSKLKIEFGVAEKEKLEAQTRLEVLSTYFKEKETQLQKELSAKEALWLKSQGETTSTVEKIQALNNEVQQLKSQKDALCAEIEAQTAAHKLNISSIEAQAHTAWLNARQAERRLEETRTEAAALRRRLTQIAETPTSSGSDLHNGLPSVFNETMKSIPSPERVESPNNPNQMMPPPLMMPPFLPQGFMPGAPPPFLPPFMPPPPGDHLPPLGRLMSPPPKRYNERERYSPRGSRGRYTPDSRYDDDDYTAFETETDYSPPPSPSPPRRGYNSQSDRSKMSKGGNSSTGSVDSNPRRKK